MRNGGVAPRRWAVSDLPEGQSGRWAVQRRRAYLGAVLGLPDLLAGYRPVEPGLVTLLVDLDDENVWMGDTADEQADHAAVLDAKGRVLIHGLGLGCIANWLLQDPEVERVDIVEIDPDVIALVAPWLIRKWPGRVRVHEGDAFTFGWSVGTRFDTIWSDIWLAIAVENLPEMELLIDRNAYLGGQHELWGRREILDRLAR